MWWVNIIIDECELSPGSSLPHSLLDSPGTEREAGRRKTPQVGLEMGLTNHRSEHQKRGGAARLPDTLAKGPPPVPLPRFPIRARHTFAQSSHSEVRHSAQLRRPHRPPACLRGLPLYWISQGGTQPAPFLTF